MYKKVLLRERKKHPARRVASARYAALSNGGVPYPIMGGGVPIQSWPGGYPNPVLARGYPIQSWPGGYPIQSWPGGYPSQSLVGVPGVTPTIQTWDGVPPSTPGMRYPPYRPGMGYPHPDLGWGTPTQDWMGYPPNLDVDWHTKWKYYLPQSFGSGL